MKSNYLFKRGKSYLYLTISGEYDFSDFENYIEIIKHECEKEKIFKVIMDVNDVVGTDVALADRFFLGEKSAKILGYKIKVAVVWPEKHINKFAETVSFNRGGNMYVVGDIKKAIEWILSKK